MEENIVIRRSEPESSFYDDFINTRYHLQFLDELSIENKKLSKFINIDNRIKYENKTGIFNGHKLFKLGINKNMFNVYPHEIREHDIQKYMKSKNYFLNALYYGFRAKFESSKYPGLYFTVKEHIVNLEKEYVLNIRDLVYQEVGKFITIKGLLNIISSYIIILN